MSRIIRAVEIAIALNTVTVESQENIVAIVDKPFYRHGRGSGPVTIDELDDAASVGIVDVIDRFNHVGAIIFQRDPPEAISAIPTVLGNDTRGDLGLFRYSSTTIVLLYIGSLVLVLGVK